MTHLPHLNDLPPRVARGEVDAWIEALSCGALPDRTITVKWDGSPAVVFGKDERGFYIGTKGVFTKTPVRARSVDEIDSLWIGMLANKLAAAWQVLTQVELAAPFQVQGDWLFAEPVHTTVGIIFGPNTLLYTLPHLDRQVALGMALHTWHDNAPHPITSTQLAAFQQLPTLWLAPQAVAAWKDEGALDRLCHARQRLIRGGRQWKEVKTAILGQIAWPAGVQACDTHEGLVVWGPTGPYKIVDPTFTRLNNIHHGRVRP